MTMYIRKLENNTKAVPNKEKNLYKEKILNEEEINKYYEEEPDITEALRWNFKLFLWSY